MNSKAVPHTRPDPDTFDWRSDLIAEFKRAGDNGCVGSILVSETDRVRVWHLRLAPGERIGFHTHVLDYFWSAHTAGITRSHVDDGSVVQTRYQSGSTRHFHFGAGERMTHDLTNIGHGDMVFTTVEFLHGANPALWVPDAVRRPADQAA